MTKGRVRQFYAVPRATDDRRRS